MWLDQSQLDILIKESKSVFRSFIASSSPSVGHSYEQLAICLNDYSFHEICKGDGRDLVSRIREEKHVGKPRHSPPIVLTSRYSKCGCVWVRQNKITSRL